MMSPEEFKAAGLNKLSPEELQKLDAWSKRRPMIASPSTAHLFIVAPMVGGETLASLFSTHPPIAKRIERLTGVPAEQQF